MSAATVITVSELACELGADFEGDGDIAIRRPNEPALALADEIALAADPRFLPALAHGSARVAIVPVETDWQQLGLDAVIFVDAPRRAMVDLANALEVPWSRDWGSNTNIHPSAIVHATAQIDPSAIIGPFSIIGANTQIGKSAVIHDHVTIAQEVQIGAECQLYSGVRIGPQVRIGHACIVMANSVIGADGFSYLTPNAEAIRDARNSGASSAMSDLAIERINSLGSVVLGDRVEMGANCAIDRGTLKDTRIGSGTKIDNLVHIAHNVQVGENCLFAGQVGIAGSSVIGDRTILGGQVGVADNIRVGSDVIAAGKSAISSSVASGQTVMGNPAIKMTQNVASYKAYRRLPRLAETVRSLEKRLDSLSKSSKDGE